jgi:hypothetical protein
MFSIQYQAVNGEHQMQTFDGKRSRLIAHLAQFPWPIMAVYEQATPITKAVRRELRIWPGSKSPCALDFIRSPA